jgi:type IV pilus assembly protein PilA
MMPLRRQTSGPRGFTLIELMIVVAVVGILTAVAIPTFLRYQSKARQTEVKSNLGGIFVIEASYFGENGRYGSFSEIGFALAGMENRYTYRSGAAGSAGGTSTNTAVIDYLPATAGPIVGEGSPVATTSATGFTATAAANLDSDPVLDQWSLNDIKKEPTSSSNDTLN